MIMQQILLERPTELTVYNNNKIVIKSEAAKGIWYLEYLFLREIEVKNM